MKNIIFLYTTVLFCLSAYSQTSDQLFNESLKSYTDKDYYHALKSVERSIQADSGNGKAYYLRGSIYFTTNQFKQAIPGVLAERQ
jgi:tetratricopeptide (TPR) repeat protein